MRGDPLPLISVADPSFSLAKAAKSGSTLDSTQTNCDRSYWMFKDSPMEAGILLASTEMETVSPGAPVALETVTVGCPAALALASPMPSSRHNARTRHVSLWESRLVSMITPSFDDKNGEPPEKKIQGCPRAGQSLHNPISRGCWVNSSIHQRPKKVNRMHISIIERGKNI